MEAPLRTALVLCLRSSSPALRMSWCLAHGACLTAVLPSLFYSCCSCGAGWLWGTEWLQGLMWAFPADAFLRSSLRCFTAAVPAKGVWEKTCVFLCVSASRAGAGITGTLSIIPLHLNTSYTGTHCFSCPLYTCTGLHTLTISSSM